MPAWDFWEQMWITNTSKVALEGVVITATLKPENLINTWRLADWLEDGGVKINNSIVWNIGTINPDQGVFRELVARTYSNAANQWITVEITVSATGMQPVVDSHKFYVYPAP